MYKQIKNSITNQVAAVVERLEDNAFIPCDPANTDYQAYLKWLDAGNVPIPAEEGNTPEPRIPPSDAVTFETIELDANKENLLLKVACGLVGAPVIASVDDAYGNCQQFEGVLDETGRFSFSASLSNINDGPLQLVALINYGEIQTELTFELSRGV